ncbi:MAG: cell wall hydrolase [Lachnospiraceae bacterium]|nr:cell wall hydrolase [Lachnospiraceae bacterium]
MSFKKAVVLLLAVSMLLGTALTTTTAEAAKKKYTNREVKLLASIIFCEAGNQSYAGKLAVGCVVMNRKRSHSFPNSVEGVIRQRGQFSPVRQGKFSRELKKYKNGAYKKGARAQCVRAAKAALSGQTYVRTRGKKISMRKYHFFSTRLHRAKLRIGAHDFK